jgi:hypothetical protein
MQIDKTTKFLLAVIAICLIWIGVNTMPTASAGSEDIVQVDIVKIDGRNIGPFCTPVPVRMVEK